MWQEFPLPCVRLQPQWTESGSSGKELILCCLSWGFPSFFPKWHWEETTRKHQKLEHVSLRRALPFLQRKFLYRFQLFFLLCAIIQTILPWLLLAVAKEQSCLRIPEKTSHSSLPHNTLNLANLIYPESTTINHTIPLSLFLSTLKAAVHTQAPSNSLTPTPS